MISTWMGLDDDDLYTFAAYIRLDHVATGLGFRRLDTAQVALMREMVLLYL